MIELQGQYYDGKISGSKSAKLVYRESGVELSAEDIHLIYAQDDLKLQPRLANIAARFEFSDGIVFEASDQPGLDDVYKKLHQGTFHKLVHKLENKINYIVPTFVVAVVMLWSLIQYGIPQFAKSVAYQIPIEYETRMGYETLSLIDKTVCEPSKLDRQLQSQLRQKMLNLYKPVDHLRVEFRYCEAIGANALALPSGIIIFTDDMVSMSKHDHELLGVFTHEVGHIEYRHTLRHVLQDSIAGLLIVMLTGDVGSASSMAAALPAVLMQTKFSRDFEREADSYAAEFMQNNKMQPVHFANILERLEEEYGEEGSTDSFLSTHPLTKERVSFLTNSKNNMNKGESDE